MALLLGRARWPARPFGWEEDEGRCMEVARFPWGTWTHRRPVAHRIVQEKPPATQPGEPAQAPLTVTVQPGGRAQWQPWK